MKAATSQQTVRPSVSEVAALLSAFWAAPDEAYFPPDVVAVVLDTTPLALAGKRWRREGPPYRKPGRTPLYRKRDITAYIEEAKGHEPR